MTLLQKLFASIALLCLLSCSTAKRHYNSLANSDKALADSLLAFALDHEALYTLVDTLKPMSSVKLLKFNVAKDSAVAMWNASIFSPKSLDSISLYTRLCKALSTKSKQLFLVPFSRTDKGFRDMEIYVVDKKRFASVINQHASFFGQFAITKEMEPAQVVTIIEYENKYDRWRGYGYLFGYPTHAVDFFVQAGKAQDSSGTLVERSFFQIPVYAGEAGYFTYAVPRGYPSSAVDSTIYRKAIAKLTWYKKTRKTYEKRGELKAVKFFRK